MLLDTFLIFNPSEITKNGRKGGEDTADLMEQILFYHSASVATVSTDEGTTVKVKLMGLAQTLHSFVAYFNKDLDGGSRGQDEDGMVWKTSGGSTAILKRVEGDYWMLLKLRVESAATATTTSIPKLSNGDQFLGWLIQSTYDRFKFFHHSFFRVRVDSTSKDNFKSSLESYFEPYIQALESACLYPSLAIIESGIQMAPFPNETMYRKAFTTCTRLLTSIPLEKGKFMLLWKETLCWSALDSNQDTKIIYDYLTNESTGLYPDQILNQVKEKGDSAITYRAYPRNTTPPSSSIHSRSVKTSGRSEGGILQSFDSFFRKQSKERIPFSGFLIGPDLNSYPNTIHDAPIQPKIVYLQGGSKSTNSSPSSSIPHILIVYQFKDDYTLCLLSPMIESSQFGSLLWYKSLQSVILQALEPLDKMILEKRDGIDNLLRIPDRSFYFLTLNQTDLVIQKGLRTKSHATLGPDLLDTLAKIRIDLERQTPGVGAGKEALREILFEASNHGKRVWISATYSSPRISIIILHVQESSDFTLGRIQDEINFLKATMLTSFYS